MSFYIYLHIQVCLVMEYAEGGSLYNCEYINMHFGIKIGLINKLNVV